MAPRVKVLIISMTGAEARRRAFEHPGEVLPWSFFDALEAAHPDLLIDDFSIKRTLGRSMSKGEIGCYSSHYAVWNSLVEDDSFDCYVVLEDDVMVDWQSLKNILDFDGEMPGYVRLYYKRPVLFREVERRFGETSKSLLEIYGHAFGTQAYVISKSAAKRFLSICRVVERPIDDVMDRSWEHGMKSFAIFPFPVIEKSVPSSIEIDRDRNRMNRSTPSLSMSEILTKARFHLGRVRFILGV